MGQNELTGKTDTRLIEDVKEHTPVGGEEAYSFTYTLGREFGLLEAVQEPITVIHDDTGYIFAFSGTTTNFDAQENVEFRERMLNSIEFLDGGGSDANDEDEDSVEVEAKEDDENIEEDDNEGGDDANVFN